MPENVTAESAAAPPEKPAAKSPDGKSGNLSGNQVAHKLAAKLVAAATPTPSRSEQAKPAEKPAEKPATSEPAEAAPPIPEGKAEPTAKAEPEKPDPDDVLSDKPSLDPKLQATIDKRIGKEVAKRKALEEENARLKAALGTPPQGAQPTQQPTANLNQPLASITDVQSLLKEQASMKEVKRWAQSQLIREDIPAEGIEYAGKRYTRTDLNGIVLQADVALEDHIPQRYQFLQGRQAAEQEALAILPELKDRSSPEYLGMLEAYRTNPWLHGLPEAPRIIAVQILGRQHLEARAKAKQKPAEEPAAPAEAPKPPASQVATGAAPGPIRETPGTSAQKKLSAELERLKQKGNVNSRDVASLLMQKELSRNR
jgi:hypothetical protein